MDKYVRSTDQPGPEEETRRGGWRGPGDRLWRWMAPLPRLHPPPVFTCRHCPLRTQRGTLKSKTVIDSFSQEGVSTTTVAISIRAPRRPQAQNTSIFLPNIVQHFTLLHYAPHPPLPSPPPIGLRVSSSFSQRPPQSPQLAPPLPLLPSRSQPPATCPPLLRPPSLSSSSSSSSLLLLLSAALSTFPPKPTSPLVVVLKSLPNPTFSVTLNRPHPAPPPPSPPAPSPCP